MSRLRAVLAVVLGVVLTAGCTSDAVWNGPDASTQALTALPTAETIVVEGSGAVALALATSQAIYRSAPAVVLVGEQDTDALERAATLAVQLGVPLLVTPAPPAPTPAGTDAAATVGPTVAGIAAPEPGEDADPKAEIERLGARAVVTAGGGAAQWVSTAGLPGSVAVSTVDERAPAVTPPTPLSSLTVLARGNATDAAAVATVRAAGARVLELGTADPRATSESVRAVAEAAPGQVLALGSAFGPPDRLRQRLATAATGVELPAGGQVVFPGRRMVALYGHPGDGGGLGVLGEQGVEAAITRAKQHAAWYEAFYDEPVVPTFEIIASVVQGSPTSDGDYSFEWPVDKFRPWVDAAREAGVYVMLDLQPGRSDFLSQAKFYEDLLLEPNVGLALDAEWRMGPNQTVAGVPPGKVSAAEVNATAAWLADLVREHNLPQKLLILHWFHFGSNPGEGSYPDAKKIQTDWDEVQVMVHMDGQGSRGAKHNTWNELHKRAPAGAVWGWKNFYDEDNPTFTPAETVAVAPTEILFISYQ